jgi:hypothetical protein
MANPLPITGNIRPAYVFCRPTDLNVLESGMAMASNGIMKLTTTTANTSARKGKRNTINAKAAVALISRPKTTVNAVTRMELNTVRPSWPLSSRAKFTAVSVFGISE